MIPPDEVRGQLAKILASQTLAGSDQLKRLLRVVVERALNGNGESVKEYALGVEAFGRSEDYDPKIDPIVRVQARRLRAKLEEYYSGEGAADTVVIQIPKGGYVPTFELRTSQTSSLSAPRHLSRAWLLAAAAILAAIAAWAFSERRGQVDALSIAVLPIRNLTGDPSKQYLADKTTEALITDLARAGKLRVVSSTTSRRFADSRQSLPAIAKALRVRWIVEGATGYEQGQILLKVRAVDALSDRKVWADAFVTPMEQLSSAQAKAAAAIAKAVQDSAGG